MSEAQEWVAYVARKNETEVQREIHRVMFGLVIDGGARGDDLAVATGVRRLKELGGPVIDFSLFQENPPKALDTEGGDMIHYGATT